jgi:flagellar biogenesis protein FliO
MIRARAYAGIVALSVTCLTANAAMADAETNASPEAPATSASVEAERQVRPWLAKPPAKLVVAGESPAIPWKSAALIAVVLGAGALVWRHRNKWRAFAQAKPTARLSVTGSVRVGPRAHLVLAQVGERSLLLGVTDDSVRRIAWIDQPTVEGARTSETRLDARPDPEPERKFLEVLRGLSNQGPSGPPPRQAGGAALEIASASRDTVEWSHGAAAPKRARLAASPKPAPSAPAGRPGAPSEAVSPARGDESVAPRPGVLPDETDPLEEQAAGLRRKARRRG